MGLRLEVGFDGVHQGAASNFCSASKHRDANVHHHSLEPSNLIAEDIALAGTWSGVVNDYIGFRTKRGHFGQDADIVKEQKL